MKKQTIKKLILNFVESHGQASWKEIHVYACSLIGLLSDDTTRGRFSSYFSGHSQWLSKIQGIEKRTKNSHGLLMRPTKSDNRYLEKLSSGKYQICYTS